VKKTIKNIDLNLISNLVLSIIVLLMGVMIMIFKSFGLIDIVLYISILFYIYAFFSTIAYFIRRKENDYELLLLSLINIITATFMFIFKEDNAPMILGTGMTIFTILVVANRGLRVLQLKKENSFMWIIKFIVTFLIGFLGMLTMLNLFNEVTVQTMMFGFYFMSLGFMLIIESIIEIFITDDTFKKILSKILEDETNKNLEEIKEKTSEEKNKKVKTEVKTINKVELGTSVATKKISKTKEATSAKIKKEVKKEASKNIKTTEPTIATTPKTKIAKKTPGRPKKSIEKEVAKKSNRPKKINWWILVKLKNFFFIYFKRKITKK